MAFASLVNGGADCGPSNPLQQLVKGYGSDRGVQQDQFGGVSAGGSSAQQQQRNGFRGSGSRTPVSAGGRGGQDEAARFFASGGGPGQGQGAPFDMAPLNRALPPSAQQVSAAGPSWSHAFMEREERARSTSPLNQQDGPGLAAYSRPFQPGGAEQWGKDFVAYDRPASQPQQRVGGGGGIASSGRPEAQMDSYTPGSYASYADPRTRMSVPQMASMFGMQRPGPQQHVSAPMDQSSRGAMLVGTSAQATDWELAFKAQENLASKAEQSAINEAVRAASALDPTLSDKEARDALAQTAGALLQSVETAERQRSHEEQSGQQSRDDKFANSSFLELMRKLRDGEVAVEGDKVVEQLGPSSSLDKGKGKASNWASEFGREEEGRTGGASVHDRPTTSWAGASSSNPQTFATQAHEFATRESLNAQRVREQIRGYSEMNEMYREEDDIRAQAEAAKRRFHFQGDGGGLDLDDQMMADTRVAGATSGWEEDFDADPSMIVGGHAPRTATKPPVASAQQKEWEQLQEDWDAFEATTTGIRAVSATTQEIAGYRFAKANPYTGDESMAPERFHHSLYESVLEKEAQVQRDPLDASRWYELGISLQSYEHEEKAIAALRRSVELDASLTGAHLALAVSYTNENERSLAYEAIDNWVGSQVHTSYGPLIGNYRELFGPLPPSGLQERRTYLTNLLINLAREGAGAEGGEIDAEVQIALGVLFNTSDEYEKAGDCFAAALSVRPDDPLLFNRLGATLANSGRADQSIQYYMEAIEIQPTYVRARYNLAIALINLAQYTNAVEHLLTALSIQELDAELQSTANAAGSDDAESGITSQSLWDSLNLALLMSHRSDLASLTERRDLSVFRQDFSF